MFDLDLIDFEKHFLYKSGGNTVKELEYIRTQLWSLATFLNETYQNAYTQAMPGNHRRKKLEELPIAAQFAIRKQAIELFNNGVRFPFERMFQNTPMIEAVNNGN